MRPTVVEKTRSIIEINPDSGTVTKRYRDPAVAANEIYWYQRLDYGHPKLLDADPDKGILVTEYHQPCTQRPNYRPIESLLRLLRRLESDHIHHRDVHPGNIVRGTQGPLLVDWESGIQADAPSYDLYGPDISGVPVPEIHAALKTDYRMWWNSDHRMSIRNVWSTSAPLP